jgi:hypothetical protein
MVFDGRISKIAAAMANATFYDLEDSRKYLEGALRMKQPTLRNLYCELLKELHDVAASYGDPPILNVSACEGSAFSSPFSKVGGKSSAIDVSPDVMENLQQKCRASMQGLETFWADALDALGSLKIQSRQSDVAAAISFLLQFPDYMDLMRDVVSLLADHGQFFSSENPLRFDSVVERLAKAFCNMASPWLVFQGDVAGGLRRYVRRRLSRRLRKDLKRLLLPGGLPGASGSSDNPGRAGVLDIFDQIAACFHTNRFSVYQAILLIAFVAFTAIRNAWEGVHLDEANWLMQTEHLQAGYFFHPPFIVYELFVLTKLFGTSPFVLRLGSLIFTTLSLILVYAISSKMFEEQGWAFLATLVVAVLPITNYWLTLGQQDPPMISLWLLTVYLVWQAVSQERTGYWYMAGLSAGFMLLCNLRSTLLFPGLFLYLLTSGENRHWLRREEPYLAFAIALLMFMPTLIWYARHHFEPITYQLKNRPGFMQYDIAGYLIFVPVHILKEMIVLSPFVYLLSIFGVIYGSYLSFSGKYKDDRFKLLFWASAPMIIFFTVTGGNAYWAIPGHLVSLIAALGTFPILLSQTSRQFLLNYSRPALVVLCVLVALLFTAGTLAIVGDGGKSDSKQLAQKVDEIISGLSSGEIYVASPDYFLPSLMSYYQKDKPTGYTLAFQVYEHKALAAGKSSEYSPWVPLNSLEGKDIIFIDEKMTPDRFEVPGSYWAEKLKPYFESLDEPTIVVGRERGKSRVFYIFTGKGFKGPDANIDDNAGLDQYKPKSKYKVDPLQL